MSEKIYNVDGSEATPPPLHKVFLSCNLKKELRVYSGGWGEPEMKVVIFAPILIAVTPAHYLHNEYGIKDRRELYNLFSICPN